MRMIVKTLAARRKTSRSPEAPSKRLAVKAFRRARKEYFNGLLATTLLACVWLRYAHAETVTLPATANAGISSIRPQTNNGHDMDLSWGSGDTLAIRQNQNWSGFENKTILLNFDMKAVKGWTIKQAYLHVALAKGDLYGVGLCSVLNDWREPTVDGQVEPGAPCWNYRASPKPGDEVGGENWWAWPDSGLYSVAWLHPALRYSHAGPNQLDRYTDPDGVHWIKIPVDPALVSALACGVSYGMVMTDDKGQVAEAAMLDKNPKPYTYDPSFEMQIYSRHAKNGTLAPKLEVTGAIIPTSGPGSFKDFQVVGVNPVTGVITLEFTTPEGNGEIPPVFAYYARYFREGTASNRVARYALPLPAAPGQKQTVQLMTVPRGSWRVAFQAVDAVGTPNADVRFDVTVPKQPESDFAVVKKLEMRPHDNGPVPTTDGKAVAWLAGDLFNFDPLNGKTNYTAGNGILLNAAQNEVVGCQVVIQRLAGELANVRVECSNLIGPENSKITADGHVQLFREYYFKVKDKDGVQRWFPDACIPLTAPFGSAFSIPGDNVGSEQMNQAVWVDIHAPRDAAPGLYSGRITITSSSLKAPLTLNVALNVRNFALPDEISFPVELNTYSGIGAFQNLSLDKEPERFLRAERRYYQLAQQHRLTLNILRYSHSGRISEKAAPPLDGDGAKRHVTDWAGWDSRFGPLLDGSAFSEAAGYTGPGLNTPVAHFYLPVHENWPMNLDDYYQDKADFPTRPEYAEWAKKSRRLDETVAAPYKDGYENVVSTMFKHFADKGWTKTNFQFFFNNKYYFKCNFFVDAILGGGAAKPGGRCYWLLDEPVDFDDFDANRFFLSLARKGVDASGASNVKVQYRTDISNPHMARGLWDGVCDLWDCSFLSEIASSALVRQKMLPNEKWWNYGGGSNVGQASSTMEQTFLNRYTWGCVGYLPYWSNFGEGDAWKTASGLSIYYTGNNFAGSGKTYDGPIAGLRMKLMRRAQQDIEYLNLLAKSRDWSRDRVIQALAKYADNPESQSGFTFNKLTNGGIYRLREAVARSIEDARAPK